MQYDLLRDALRRTDEGNEPDENGRTEFTGDYFGTDYMDEDFPVDDELGVEELAERDEDGRYARKHLSYAHITNINLVLPSRKVREGTTPFGNRSARLLHRRPGEMMTMMTTKTRGGGLES